MGSVKHSHPRAAWATSAALFFFCVCAQAQAPIIDASQPSGTRSSRPATGGAATGGSGAVGELYQQLQALQQEVMELRGKVEEQNHQIETLRQQSLDRYNDLDRRLGGGAAPAAAATPAAAVPAESGGAINAAATPAEPAAGSAANPKPDEYEAYRQAFAKFKAQDITGAIKAFTAFINDYPNGTLTSNAFYWLGESYLQPPADLNSAQVAFTKVVGDYPQSNKAPDALYKLGKIYFQKGDKAKSKQLLQQVIDDYGSSGSSAPQLAKQFLDQNFRK